MSVRRGISLLDILPPTTALAIQAPDATVETIGILTVLDHRATTSADFFLHEGVLQSPADALDLNTANWPVRIPGLTHGLPFRLAIQRMPIPAGGQEAVPALWALDIEVRDVEVVIPGARAAAPVGGSGITPLSLAPVAGGPQAQRVLLVASAVLRIAGGGPGGTQVQLVDSPDPLDPLAPTGGVVRIGARPPHFLFGQSQFGMTLDSFVLDFSPAFTPPEIAARGHDEAWQGVAFKETTFYFPPNTPLLNSLSISTRDVIIGDPGGLQGEVRIEFGHDFNDVFNTRLTVKQRTDAGAEGDVARSGALQPGQTALTYPVPAGPNGAPRRVRALFEVGPSASIPGHAGLYAVGAWWRLPDGREGTGAATPWFDAPTDGLLRYRLRVGEQGTAGNVAATPSAVPADQTELGEVTVAFPRQAGSPSGQAPIIDATIGGVTYRNVLHLRGTRARLAGIALAKRPGAPAGPDAEWRLGSGAAPPGGRGPGFTLPMLDQGVAAADLTAADADGTRRLRIEVVPEGPLVVGHQKSTAAADPAVVTVIGAGPATPTAVSQTFLAAPFHAGGARAASAVPSTLAATDVAIPQGADAEVEVPVPAGAAEPLPDVPPAQVASRRTVQVLFGWEEPLRSNQGPTRVVYPYAGIPGAAETQQHEAAALEMALGLDTREELPGASATERLRGWIAALGPPAGTRTYAIVGRTDDLWYGAVQADNKQRNDELAAARLEKVREALVAAGADPGSIVARVESAAAFTPVPPAGALDKAPPRIKGGGRLALPNGKIAKPAGANAPVWRDGWNPDALNAAIHAAAKDDPRRPPYRSVEIHAADSGAPPPVVVPPAGPLTVIRVLVPGPDGAPADPVVTTSGGPPPTDYRVRLRAKWDSPTVVTLADGVPTEAEALIAWKTAQVEVPGVANPIPAPTGQDFWELVLRWAYDSRTGETEASGALSLPDGTVNIASNALAGAMAIGPALTATLAPGDAIGDPLGQFVLASAMIAAGAAIGEALNAAPGATPGRVDIDKVAISYRWNGAARVAATLDYTVDLRINVAVAGAGSLSGLLRLRYKGVGLRFDGPKGGGGTLAGVALTYDDLSVQVVDPGTWSLGGPLGNLIRIAASRMGNGSQWMEFDLEFALDLGVVRLEGARIRLDLDPFKVEFRGLTASVDIPGTLRGRGSVTIGDGGSFRALLALEVIPAKLSAYGALAVDQDFVAVEVGVQLPVGIPLGATGFGIFGFMGRFVANGTRDLSKVPPGGDPVQRQLGWYVLDPKDKYTRKPGQYAFGVGAVVGTLPDGAFTFNAEGSLTIGFPDISVVFGIDAKLVSERKQAATEKGAPNNASFRILGVVVIEPESIMVAVRARYEIPKVLRLEVPISAYFPLAGGDAWFIRIGTDNHAKRPGDPVTITLLPETLDVRAWAFMLIEEKGIEGLGGTIVPLDLAQPLDFDGFSIGMGAGFDLKWEAGPFSLEISAFLLVGMGTKPLLFAGAAGVAGELDLVVISVGVDGLVHFHVSPGYKYVEGHFCGHVDCFFFEVSGCVDIRIGDPAPSDIPKPASPIAGLDLCDHLAVVKGRAAAGGAGAPPVVWPDTIAVLRFQHFVADALGAGADFDRKVKPPAALSPWSGTTELKYAYRLTAVTLWKLKPGANPALEASWDKVPGPFDAAWWLPTHRAAIIQGGDAPGPSTEEGRELGLFTCDPRAWSRWLGEGSQDLPGDPAGTVEEICEQSAPADPSCALGRDRKPATGHLAGFKAEPKPGAAFPSRFTAFADLDEGLDMATLAALGADAGWAWMPGAVAPLHVPAVVHGETIGTGWRFPGWRKAGTHVASAPIRLGLSKPLLEGELTLEFCEENRDGRIPGIGACDTMPDKDGPYGGFTGKSGAQYEGSGLAFESGSERALRLLQGLLNGSHPGTVGSVMVDLDPGKEDASVVAYAANGASLGSATAIAGGGRQRLTVTAAGIVRVAIRGTDQPVVFEVCWGGGRPAILGLVPIEPLAAPLVVATGVDGKTLVLPGTPLNALPKDDKAPPCRTWRFKLPAGPGWTRLEVAAWTKGDVTLVSLCGVTLEAAAAQQEDAGFRAGLQLWLLDLAEKAETDTPTHDVHLDAASTYEIRAAWQYQGWRPPSPGAEPPPPGSWTDGGTDRFRFATAAFGLAPAPAPAQNASLDVDPAQGGPGFDERTFDPRGIARFVMRAAPGEEDAPHFLDDPAGFWFSADHLEKLVAKYDRTLQVKVLHTRPAPGALHQAPLHVAGGLHLLDVTQTVDWSIDTLSWFEADHRLVEAALDAPCIGKPPALGSSSVSVTADLQPRSEYDLLLNAAPKTLGTFPETPIARSHFRTSRYRNPTGLLRALGFSTPHALAVPQDAVAKVAIPGGALQTGDTELDALLATIGLDPWPLPAAPRGTVVWLPPAGAGLPWRIAGVLLEADEPIRREGFRTGAIGEAAPPPLLEILSLRVFRTYDQPKIVIVTPGSPPPPPGGATITKRVALGQVLTERVRNASGTRILLRAGTPIAMSGGRLYDLELQFGERGSPGASGRATLLDRPLTLAQEGL